MSFSRSIQFVQNMGLRYVSYRIVHELEKRLGILKRKHPKSLRPSKYVEKTVLYDLECFVVNSRENVCFSKTHGQELKHNVERILKGEFLFFSSTWIDLGNDYDWVSNPITGYRYDVKKHWSEIEDLSSKAGDIKFVWEKSRFSYLHTLIRYDHHFDVDLSEFVFNDIESWIDENPINCGPNWRCSQEISLRIINWYYALQYYKKSEALTDVRWRKIQDVIFASLHHVYHHINFSRIAVRNNHAITETLFLALSDILFPFIPETKNWAKEGKKWFEEEVEYQIYEDGTFLQFSMNYHRVVVQLLNFAISLYTKNNLFFNKVVYERAYKSVNFLYQCMQDENGRLPNYGSNDGALFFPLSDSDYRDYRPQLNALHYTLTGSYLDLDFNKEECLWFGKETIKMFDPISKIKGFLSFDVGGYYICRERDLFTFIRCGNHKDRPAQADNLHLDIWYKGKNLLRDSGSYKYNTSQDKLEYFSGTVSHNTVMVNDNSQMLKGGRFIWYYWTQCIDAKWIDSDEYYVFEGKISAFRFINSKVVHTRKIKIYKKGLMLNVVDSVSDCDEYFKKQIWHSTSPKLSIQSDSNKKRIFNSFVSDYYGRYEESESIYFEFNNEIETNLEIKE